MQILQDQIEQVRRERHELSNIKREYETKLQKLTPRRKKFEDGGRRWREGSADSALDSSRRDRGDIGERMTSNSRFLPVDTPPDAEPDFSKMMLKPTMMGLGGDGAGDVIGKKSWPDTSAMENTDQLDKLLREFAAREGAWR